ncbi:glycoside hydrolase family 2 protein [Mucilaginibacter paludis]|uniref:Glycoside hydrolase family 2 sugar binding n=1 Tax=Mucilaginibacter paludis DSM 18603 TaxID=714943 RepID=H1YBJ4_9SPHI|nr:glycoside hydrolase family 2 TIM barrel-domain containing protein [Mucilaginibacter paludis]EHQ25065.1 glycoside hydrolase family 2 sugar binding [Mucilaginibacter paludis DSM 18603]
MNNKLFCFLLLCLLPGWLAHRAYAQAGGVKQVQLTEFQLQSSVLTKADGARLTQKNEQPAGKWYPVRVPCTVLGGLVANSVYPSPYFGLNNMLIPDASDEFNKAYRLEKYSYIKGHPNPWKNPYWYRTIFTVPAADKGRLFQLIFKGINYRAEVWLNGVRIADSTQMVGMFAEYSLNISKQVKAGGSNILAVKIYPLDYPGLPAKEQLKALGPFYENGGPTGDIGKNVTMLCSAGWDWMPPVRDRNMGIWQPVYLRTTGMVTISHPKLVTNLPGLPDTTKAADLALGLTLANYGGQPVNGKLRLSIMPENFAGATLTLNHTVSMQPGEVKTIDLGAGQFKELVIKQPRLWWPNGYGRANLYRIRLQYVNQGRVLDDTSFVFGIRNVATKTTDVNGFVRREFFVNGRRVHLNGGAWVPDLMVNRDSARYDHELQLCRNANVNLVRIWGGGITPPDQFWNDCDKYGLMVWSDFWITGDTQGEFKGSPDWPLESNVFVNNIKSTIYRIRNHPSLLVWTGGNEGHARKELYDQMRNSIIKLDGTRPYIPSSSGFAKLPVGWAGAWPDDGPAGVYSGGPYAWKDPKAYYKLADAGKDWVFKDETGLPSQPPYNTLAKNIPDTSWDNTLPFPLNNMWGYHDAATGAAKYDEYYKEMVSRYGAPLSRLDFSNKMQLMNATGYQGIFESVGHKLTETGGVMLWKLNSAFPSVVWQIYDWYLQPNAGYYFMQNAVEPVHVQFNQNDSTVVLINRAHQPTGPVSMQAEIYDQYSKLKYEKNAMLGIDDEGVKVGVNLAADLKSVKGFSFVLLRLKNGKGDVISRNAYWMAPGNDYKPLNTLPPVHLNARVTKLKQGKFEDDWTLQVSNPGNGIAFFIRPQLMVDQEEVRPSYWSAAYFTLAPNTSITITVSAPTSKLKGGKPTLTVEAWNATKQLVQ